MLAPSNLVKTISGKILRFLAVRFVQASAVHIGFPQQLAEVCVGKIDAFLRLELSPFVRIVSIDQRFPAFHTELNPFEGELLAMSAHLLVVEVLVIIFVVFFFGDGCVCFQYFFWPALHVLLLSGEEGCPLDRSAQIHLKLPVARNTWTERVVPKKDIVSIHAGHFADTFWRDTFVAQN